MSFGHQVVLDCAVHRRIQGFESFRARINSCFFNRSFESTFATHILLCAALIDSLFFDG